MSPSFVSKSVQTTTEDGGFVEEAIEGADANDKGSTGVHKPLFEQLRANKEQEEAEREEYQKAMMRGTLALDEEDAAHLESLRRKRQEEQDEVNRRTEEELAAFRAARADRSEESRQAKEQEETKFIPPVVEEPKNAPKPKLAAPQIRIKRKRRKEEANEESEKKSKTSEPPAKEATVPQPGLGSLLTGYDSSSDED